MSASRFKYKVVDENEGGVDNRDNSKDRREYSSRDNPTNQDNNGMDIPGTRARDKACQP
jgi:hypothetical protein